MLLNCSHRDTYFLGNIASCDIVISIYQFINGCIILDNPLDNSLDNLIDNLSGNSMDNSLGNPTLLDLGDFTSD